MYIHINIFICQWMKMILNVFDLQFIAVFEFIKVLIGMLFSVVLFYWKVDAWMTRGQLKACSCWNWIKTRLRHLNANRHPFEIKYVFWVAFIAKSHTKASVVTTLIRYHFPSHLLIKTSLLLLAMLPNPNISSSLNYQLRETFSPWRIKAHSLKLM